MSTGHLPETTASGPPKAMKAAWGILRLTLLGLITAVALLSPQFDYGGDKLARPLPQLTILMVAAGVVYLLVAALARRTPEHRGILLWIVMMGIVLRATLFFSTPICETDFYRYLWDGGVLAHGHNPFVHTPAEAAAGKAQVPAELIALGEDAGETLKRVNHHSLGTIYPVTAQKAFALAHLLRPWSLGALRLVFFLFDAATLVLVVLLLRHLGMPLPFAPFTGGTHYSSKKW